MTEPKTVPTDASVDDFLAAVDDPQRRGDAQALCALMREVTGVEPVMWGPSIVGFGRYHLRYASGRELDWPAVSFSPRRQSLTLYVSREGSEQAELLGRLGKYTTSKACLYVKRLSDVDVGVLRAIVANAFAEINGTTIDSSPGE